MITRDQFIAGAANGNAAAARFLGVFWDRAHLVDDLIDDKGAIGDEVLAAAEADWILELTANPFFVEHRAKLVPLLCLGLNAWVDSNRLPAGPVRDVLKGVWHETFYAVALLTGGWQAMRKCSEVRPYDFEADWETVPIKLDPGRLADAQEGGQNGLRR